MSCAAPDVQADMSVDLELGMQAGRHNLKIRCRPVAWRSPLQHAHPQATAKSTFRKKALACTQKFSPRRVCRDEARH